MSTNTPLEEFITTNRDQVVGRCLEKVGDRDDAKKTAALNTGIPEFLEQLIRELNTAGTMTRQIRTAATINGNSLFFQGFTATQVVHVYGSVCQSVTDLAVELNAEFTTQDFRTLNRVLDDAIAGAVAEYTRQQRKNTDTTTAIRQQEARNALHTAITAFEVIQTGNVAVHGSTANLLRRSLDRLRELV